MKAASRPTGVAGAGLVLAAALAVASATAGAQIPDTVVELPGSPGRNVRVPAPAAPGADGRYEVDVLVLYNREAEQALGGDVAGAMASRVAYANLVFDNSLIPARYRLVRVAPLAALPALGALPAAEPVVALRNEHGADVVAVLDGRGGGAACGQAFPFNGGTWAAAGPDNVDPERDAYTVIFCVDDPVTFVHELGHILGAGHDIAFSGLRDPVQQQPIPGFAQVVGSGYWRTYAHAWRCGPPGMQQCSVMHYCREPDAVARYAVTGESPFGTFFSNPRIALDGAACGSEGPVEPLQADNARSIAEAVPYVAAYREPVGAKSAPAGAGALPVHAVLALLAGALARRRRRDAGR